MCGAVGGGGVFDEEDVGDGEGWGGGEGWGVSCWGGHCGCLLENEDGVAFGVYMKIKGCKWGFVSEYAVYCCTCL